VAAQSDAKDLQVTAADTYETQAKGIRILPGQWRPHYRWEQIAWVSPAWPSQEYLWLDFPEAIFTDQGLLYLSHVNPPLPVLFSDLPKVEWRQTPEGMTFERELPNGVRFGGSVTRKHPSTVALELHLTNGSDQALTHIRLQTCLFLRGVKEFCDFTRDSKFVHVADLGWITLTQARTIKREGAPYTIGFGGKGEPVADSPVIVCVSNQAPRLVAMTWYDATASMTVNPGHPCMHADPGFPDLAPGETASVHGEVIFFEGALSDFEGSAAFARIRGS
jgi:hypothetical protein